LDRDNSEKRGLSGGAVDGKRGTKIRQDPGEGDINN
jgi:hypothetical protein